MTALVLDWAAAAHAGPQAAGGKGWQLGRMAQFGVPVPDGFVLAAQASRAHRPGQDLPPGAVQALVEALHARGWLDRPLALRSSAPQEDSAGASFAGIHLSCLNVRGPDAAQEALRRIWDSRWTPQAQAYRQRLGLTDSDAGGMAVVVMPMIEAAASGIVFTIDPATGRHDEMIIHANWGLGESLVNGQAEGDEYRLREHTLRQAWPLVARRIGAKRHATQPVPRGTRLAATPDAVAARAVLTDAQAEALGDIARDAARALDYGGRGYDIEWAWDGERFWIVQARPVTASARRTYPALQNQPDYWSRGNTREVLPQAMSALEWDAGRVMAQRMLTCGFELSGYGTLPGVRLAALFQGRAYLNASVIQWVGYDALGVKPRDMNALLGGPQPEIRVPPLTAAQRLRHGLRLVRYLRRAAPLRRQAAADLPRFMARAQAWLDAPLPASNAALGAQLREQFQTVLAADELFFLQGSGGGALSKLLEMVERAAPGEGHALTAALMAGGDPSVTAEQGYALMRLAQLAADDAPALAWLRAPGRDSAAWQAALPDGSPFKTAFADFLRRYGHRAVYETYLRNPRWREAPGYLLNSVLNLIGADPAALRARQADAARQAWQRVRRALPFWQRPLAAKLLAASRLEGNQREAARSVLVAYLAVARRIARELGRRTAGPDGLAVPDDIFHLNAAEIFALADGRISAAALGRRAAARREQLQAWAALPDPDVITEYATGDAAVGVRVGVPQTPPPGAAPGDSWRGTPVAGGHARGRAFVARTPDEGLAMPAGGILVAASSDPAWTPLFLRAGAVVMEAGGYLSHAAIVAREFGVPAVVNVQGILQGVATGDMLAVDAVRGVVRRVPDNLPDDMQGNRQDDRQNDQQNDTQDAGHPPGQTPGPGAHEAPRP
ncbi:PEP/pyruvate-binding domain-containing protein [Achromobacter sp. NFACC18-2]|uniref:PEP/pyruvate-binding domain-containing protein n=1 Tax=Achromobacter sp. NFACC18-2 TaxID=1564112 RepID=UPI0008B271DD|nr:PEP/pyruvate-binding domain-containing protein [Achromobacter sp. NFACC18-2]SEI38381.1 pyruvate, water dikinase [Achromobacter sp. NFACC18-2]